MPALPWVTLQPIGADSDYVAMASRLPIKSYRSLPGFVRDTLRIRRQLASTPGLVGYALNARPLLKTFWTFSVWDSQESLNAFASTDPHHQIVQRIQPLMNQTRFDFYRVTGAELPPRWDEIISRVS